MGDPMLRVVRDDDLGTIVAVVSRDAEIFSTAAPSDPDSVDLAGYVLMVGSLARGQDGQTSD